MIRTNYHSSPAPHTIRELPFSAPHCQDSVTPSVCCDYNEHAARSQAFDNANYNNDDSDEEIQLLYILICLYYNIQRLTVTVYILGPQLPPMATKDLAHHHLMILTVAYRRHRRSTKVKADPRLRTMTMRPNKFSPSQLAATDPSSAHQLPSLSTGSSWNWSKRFGWRLARRPKSNLAWHRSLSKWWAPYGKQCTLLTLNYADSIPCSSCLGWTQDEGSPFGGGGLWIWKWTK